MEEKGKTPEHQGSWEFPDVPGSLLLVRLAAHVSQGCKSQIRPVVGRI